MQNAWIIGATSPYAVALCHHLAKKGYSLILLDDDEQGLESIAADLSIRYDTEVLIQPCNLYHSSLSIEVLESSIGPYTLACLFMPTQVMCDAVEKESSEYEKAARELLIIPSLLLKAMIKSDRADGIIICSEHAVAERQEQVFHVSLMQALRYVVHSMSDNKKRHILIAELPVASASQTVLQRHTGQIMRAYEKGTSQMRVEAA